MPQVQYHNWQPTGRESPQYLLEVVAAPSAEPVSYDELASYCRISQTADAQLIGMLGLAARQHVETATKLSIMQSTYKVSYDCFDNLGMRLPRRPVTDTSTVSVQYYDSAGTLQTLPTNQYWVDRKGIWTTVRPLATTPFPVTALRPNAVMITFTAGQTSDVTKVGSMEKVAVLTYAKHLYDNREVAVAGSMGEVPYGLRSILSLLGAPSI